MFKNKKRITFTFIIPLLFCILVAIFVPFKSTFNCYNNGLNKECVVEKNTFINRIFSKKWEGKINSVEFISKTIKDEKKTPSIRSSRIAISRNQIVLYGDKVNYQTMYDDFYLTANPYDKLETEIKNFNENKIPLWTYEYTNIMAFVYCWYLLLAYYVILIFCQRERGVVVKHFHENGLLKSIGRMYKYEREGEWKFYDTDGKTLLGVDNYHKGKKDGLSVNYYSNGQLKEQGKYKGDIKEGIWKSYDENGKLITERYYHKGIVKKKNK